MLINKPVNPVIPFPESCLTASFLRREKRFLVEVETNGKRCWVHCNNSGTMLGLLRPGAQVLISPARGPNLKSYSFQPFIAETENTEVYMKPAIIVVDMLEGNYEFITDPARDEVRIIPGVRDFLKQCRKRRIPVIFACDSFLENDFLFRSRMKPHAIRGTAGVRPVARLEPESGDIFLEKRRFSAFFKTDLDQTLRTLNLDTVAVCGINTHFCVLATALDALSHDFSAILLEDLSAAYKREIHDSCVNAYRKSVLYPLLQVMDSTDFLSIPE